MYRLAQRDWKAVILAMEVEQIHKLDCLMMVVNPQPPTALPQLTTEHAVAALYRAITVMSDGVLFCQCRAHITLHHNDIGALSITPVKDFAPANTVRESRVVAAANVAATRLNYNRGTVKDPQDPKFVINYLYWGKDIKAKEVSLGIFEALTTAAPYDRNAECVELQVISSGGECIIIVEHVLLSIPKFSYAKATRALKLMYSEIIVPTKKFGDMSLELVYNGEKFGEIRMLKGSPNARAGNEPDIVSDA
ncbi:MAG: hypothetical protein Q9174_007046 [Haloplaca sp. 1 TL-2023]